MQNRPNQNPIQWVTSQDGSVRFDASPLLDFVKGHLAPDFQKDIKVRCDEFALRMLEQESHQSEVEMNYDLVKLFQVVRDVVLTVEKS